MEGSRDARFMSLALRLAIRAQGRTSPNPMVGAVVVNGNRVVGAGYHRRAGAAHAEVEALRAAGSRARGATLYVTLEPCHHVGRTPPCSEAIIRAGIARLVIAARDPNPITNGRGLRAVRRHGIRIVTGVLGRQAAALNEPFRKAMVSHLPFVIAKVGQSLDGKIATVHGESRWITSQAARQLTHQWRSRVDAVLVGINTVLRDDPLLTVRQARQRDGRPIKVIVDTRLRLPRSARCLSKDSPALTIIATTVRDAARHAAYRRARAQVLVSPARHGRVCLRQLCHRLARRGIQSVLIEGGGEVLASAFEERLVDRVLFFVAPVILGGRAAPSSIGGQGISRLGRAIRLDHMTVRRVGPDLCVEANVVYPKLAHSRRHTAHRRRR